MKRLALDLGDVFVVTKCRLELCCEIGMTSQSPFKKTYQQPGRGVEVRWRSCHEIARVSCVQ
jgi:hypothetical protein